MRTPIRFLVVLGCCLAACGTPTTTTPPPAVDAGTQTDAGGIEIASIEVKVSPDIICTFLCTEFGAGETRPFVAEVTDTEGHVYTDFAVQWTTGDAAIATIDESGLATGVGAGETVVRASALGKSGEIAVTVLPPRVERVVITPSAETIEADETLILTATALDDRGKPIQGVSFHWSTSDSRVAMVSPSGTVKGLAKGVAIISASADFASGWASITVSTGDAPPPGFALASVNVGDTHSCGTDANGVAYCWGWNFFGQLGNNTRGDELDRFPTPAAVVTDMRFASLRLGQYHSCGLQADGKAACWGSNSSGELGTHATIGEVGGTTVPYPVLGDLAFTQLSAGGSHTCGVTADGQAHCWGANDVGQLGKGDLANAPTPALVSQSVQFKAIAAGLYSTCALAETGEAYCWGDGTRGQLGTTATFDSSTKERAPKAVAGAKQFEQLHLNSSHACAVTKGGETYCWGNNTYGQLGSGSAVIAVGTPQKVTTDQAFVMVTTGAHHSCGLTNAGRVYCWGNNDNAQLGDGTLTSRAAPVPVLTDLSFEAIESGANATCGRTTQGEAWCWGSGYFGETGSGLGGDGSFSVVPSPVTVPVP